MSLDKSESPAKRVGGLREIALKAPGTRKKEVSQGMSGGEKSTHRRDRLSKKPSPVASKLM